MKPAPIWQYDEMKPCSVDYTDIEEVAAYDIMHRKFRDYAKSSEEIVHLTGSWKASLRGTDLESTQPNTGTDFRRPISARANNVDSDHIQQMGVVSPQQT